MPTRSSVPPRSRAPRRIDPPGGPDLRFRIRVVDGDVIRISIDRVGEMVVPVHQGTSGHTPVFDTPYTPDIVKQR